MPRPYPLLPPSISHRLHSELAPLSKRLAIFTQHLEGGFLPDPNDPYFCDLNALNGELIGILIRFERFAAFFPEAPRIRRGIEGKRFDRYRKDET